MPTLNLLRTDNHNSIFNICACVDTFGGWKISVPCESGWKENAYRYFVIGTSRPSKGFLVQFLEEQNKKNLVEKFVKEFDYQAILFEIEISSMVSNAKLAVEKLATALVNKNDKDFQDGDVHQAILNLAYDWWNSKDGNHKSYKDMIEQTQKEYGPLAAFAVLIGKYNQQVTNGGHFQYFDNGYANGEGYGNVDFQCVMHLKMIRLFEQFGFRENDYGAQVYDILTKFESYINYESDDDYDDGLKDSRLIFVDAGNHLDDEYYEINENWMKFLNNFFTRLLNTNT